MAYHPTSTEYGGESIVPVSRRYARVVFALTFGLLISDYMSRQVLNAVFPLLMQEWGLSDSPLGSLGGAVALMVGLLTFPLSLMVDRFGLLGAFQIVPVISLIAAPVFLYARTRYLTDLDCLKNVAIPQTALETLS